MRKNSKRLKHFITAFVLLAALSGGAASGQLRPTDYLRWDRYGRLDYRLLLRRYAPVSSFYYGGELYGYPYAAYGGLRQPVYVPRRPPSAGPWVEY